MSQSDGPSIYRKSKGRSGGAGTGSTDFSFLLYLKLNFPHFFDLTIQRVYVGSPKQEIRDMTYQGDEGLADMLGKEHSDDDDVE